jgi:predicted nucleic acid-binding protein
MSGFLLDTNVPSELVRTRPEPKVTNWVLAHDDSELFLSVVSVGELRKGFTVMPDGKRRANLEAWFEDHLLPLFEGRILPVTQAVADRWGVLEGSRQLAGRPLPTPDGMIAATAIEHGLTVVTRNVKDFEGLGVKITNPWNA